MAAIRARQPDAEFTGVGGDTMLAQGLRSLAPLERFAVNGFVDPLLRSGSLVRLLRLLIRELASMDVVVGVDFNVFNLLMETGVRKRGVPTAHYVSPSIYAWRRGRVARVAKAADVVLTLFPFENAVYDAAGVHAEFVGHPTADRFDPDVPKSQLKAAARVGLGLPPDAFVLCLMPGSRGSELKFHFELFLQAAREFLESTQIPHATKVIVPTRHPAALQHWQSMARDYEPLDVQITGAAATTALAASDLALVKSGTSTLEAMLVKTPMVVAYRMGALTARIIRAMMYTDRVALPNILSNKELVPEYLQDDATPANLAAGLSAQKNRDYEQLMGEFTRLHRSLKTNAAERAADAVLSLVR